MGYIITNLSFNLLVQEFLISVNIWRSYWDKWLIVSYALFALKFVVKDAELAGYKSKRTCVRQTETATDCCYVNRHTDVSLLSTNIKML